MSEARAFFEAYAEAFTKGPAAVAEFYAEPCITARAGNIRVNLTRKDAEAFFAGVDRNYRERGFRKGAIVFFMEQSMGASSLLATIHWAYQDTGGKNLWESTFSYNLYRQGGGWKILVQTMHDR